MTLPVAKIPVRVGVSLSREIATAYEWFYVEVFCGDEHLVAILATSDPFLPALAAPAPSLYLTWHSGGRVSDYAYCLFEGAAAAEFTSEVEAFFEGRCTALRLAARSHAGAHDVCLWLNWEDARASTTPSDREAFVVAANCARASGVKHFWQPLAHGPALSGRVFRSFTAEIDSPARALAIFDVPLARALRSRAKVTAPNAQGFAFSRANGWCYVDHNAGLEPLDALEHPWLWWHARSGSASEIGYWFPSQGAGYLCHTHEPDGLLAVGGFEGRNPVARPARSAFGVPIARHLELASGTTLKFDQAIEGAPFYSRLRSSGFDATLEALHPKRLGWPSCRTLMGARQHRARSLPQPYGSHDFHATCAGVTAAHGRSFYLASHVLAPRERQGAYFVYALCRLIDDATDEAHGEGSEGSGLLLDALFNSYLDPITAKRAADFVAGSFARAGAWSGGSERDTERGAAFLAEARHAVVHLVLERQPFEELVEGQRMDEAFAQPRTFAECYLYCYRVAGVVGFLMARILRTREGAGSLEAAEHLGIAMQLTNILRDVREDALTRGRVYLPTDACTRAGLGNGTSLLESAAANPHGAARLVLETAALAVGYYQSALAGVSAIPGARSRLCVRLMAAIYGSILGTLARTPLRAFESRVVVSVPRRLIAFLRVLCGADPLRVAGLAHLASTAPNLLLGSRQEPPLGLHAEQVTEPRSPSQSPSRSSSQTS